MSDPAPKPEDLPTFAEGTTAADAPTFAPDALTVSDTAVTFAQGTAVTAAALPATIGRYRIVRLIGEGGMGAVYEAEQDQPRRTVALKVIKPGLASPELLRRFAQEAQALGRLQHPGIAQIYDAGTADTGFGSQPYFAMEFIRGAALSDYANSRHLGLRERLELIVKICGRSPSPALSRLRQHGAPGRVGNQAAELTRRKNLAVHTSGFSVPGSCSCSVRGSEFGVRGAESCTARARPIVHNGRP